MHKISQTFSMLAVSVFTLGTLAVVPVSAETGPGSGDDAASSNNGSGRNKVRMASEDDSVSTASADDDGTADQGSGDMPVTTEPTEIKERGKKLVSEERTERKAAKSLEVRQKSCETRKDKIVKRSENSTRHATKHLEVFNSIYDKVLGFQEEKNLSAADFDTLKAAADAKKLAATEAVEAIADVTTDIDCTLDDPAATVATVKEAVSNARIALHEYRLSIKDVVVALQKTTETSGDSTDTADDTNQTTDTGSDSGSDATTGGTN